METGNRIHRALVVEELEQRVAPATFNVTTIGELRTAIDTANANAEADTINLAAGTYTLTGARLDNANASGDLDILADGGNAVSFIGAGAGTTIIDGNNVDRVFHIVGATTVTFQGLTIQGGEVDDDGAATTQAYGGGIFNDVGADVTLTNVTLTDNQALGAAGSDGTSPGGSSGTDGGNGTAGLWGTGGGLYMSGGTLTITNSTFTSNVAQGGVGGAGGDGASSVSSSSPVGGAGGGIYATGTTIVVTGGTFDSNSAIGGVGGAGGAGGDALSATTGAATGGVGGAGGAGPSAVGGGMYIDGGSLTVSGPMSITNNSASGGAGGQGGQGGAATGTAPAMVGGQGGAGGALGWGGGGGIYASSTTITISDPILTGNTATGGWGGIGGAGAGWGGVGGVGGFGGGGYGGGLFVDAATVALSGTNTLTDNTAVGGVGGSGGVGGAGIAGGNGGFGGGGGWGPTAEGGAVFINSGTLTIDGATTLTGNEANPTSAVQGK